MKLDTPRKWLLLAIALGAAGTAILVLTKDGEPGYSNLRFHAKELVGIAAVLAFIFFPWGGRRIGR